MKINCFEDIIAWQKAKDLTKLVYLHFKNTDDFYFKNQIQRASVSIMNNIAEGFERKSNKEFKYFLYVAKGSCAEVRSMIILSYELDKINKDDMQKMYSLSEEISKIISGFIKKLESGK